MKAARLDRRVRKEARLLLRQARALRRKPRDPALPKSPKLEGLGQAIGAMEAAVEARDPAAMRAELPRLDAIVDDLSAGHGKSTVREYVESIGVAIGIALILRAFVVEAFKIPSSSMIPTMEIGDHIFVNKFIYGVRIPWTRTKLFEVRPPRRGEVIVFMNPCIPDKDYIKRIVAVAGDTVEMRCSELYINGERVKQDLIQSKGCRYYDYDEISGSWPLKQCSRYRETIGDATYEAFYDEVRPMHDSQRQAMGSSVASYAELHNNYNHDFPELFADAGDRLDDERRPNCNKMGPEATEHPPVVGKIVRQTDLTQARRTCAPQMHYVVPDGYVFAMGDNRDNSNDSRTWGPVPVENIKGKALFIWWSSSEKAGVRFDRMGQIVH